MYSVHVYHLTLICIKEEKILIIVKYIISNVSDIELSTLPMLLVSARLLFYFGEHYKPLSPVNGL